MTDMSKSEIPEFLTRFRLLPNEYKGRSFETSFVNISVGSDRDGNLVRRTSVYWQSQSVTHSNLLAGAFPGSTIYAYVPLSDVTLSNERDGVCAVFAVGEDAKELLDAPSGATVRARVRTVYTTGPCVYNLYRHLHEVIYEDIKGLLIEEILAIENRPDD